MPFDHHTVPPAGPARALHERYGHLDGAALLDALVHEAFPGRIAVSSSFGIESAVLLHLVATVAPATPVLFLDTGMLFAQTDQYRRALADRLGLLDVRVIRPDPAHLAEYDPDDILHHRSPGTCCHLRKVLPLQRALRDFDAWITGRKRFHGGARADLAVFEADGPRIKVNPLATWDPARIRGAFRDLDLPHHPLEALGYTSVGCHPCTRIAGPDGGVRDGRWAGTEKTECGIHAPWAGQGI